MDDAPPNLARLLGFLRNRGEGCAAELTIDDFTDEEGAVRVIEEFPLDIFTRMSGWRYNDLAQYCQLHDIGTMKIPHLNPAGLILLKKKSLREKARVDVLALRRLAGGQAQ